MAVRDPSPRSAVLEGRGLHTGAPARVVLSTGTPGAPVVFRRSGPVEVEVTLAGLSVVGTHRATTIEGRTPAGVLRIATVEHLLAALAGLGVRAGLVVDVDGPELPLLDGGASAWAAALDTLGLASTPAPLRITRSETIAIGASRFELHPGPVPIVEVTLAIDDPRLAASAVWRGDARDFRARIAPARTFALGRDLDELLASGLAHHVDPASVVVVAPDAIHSAGAPFTPDEPARHKLLDLMGDLCLAGGPPRGTLRALRPGHAVNARACEAALARGLFALD